MNMQQDLVSQILSNNPGISVSELRDAVNFHMRSPGIANALGRHEGAVVAEDAVAAAGLGGGEGADPPGSGSWPEAFRVIYDPDSKSYKVQDPIVCTPSGQITATGANGLSAGTYYCKVTRNKNTYSASVTTSASTGTDTVVVVPIAEITENDGIHQQHLGTIIVSGEYHTLTVKHPDGTEDEYEIAADDDITINESDGDSNKFISDVELKLEDGKLKIVKTFSDDSTEESSIEVKTVDVVTGSSYDSDQPKAFVNMKTTLTVLDEKDEGDEETVFTATPHSEE